MRLRKEGLIKMAIHEGRPWDNLIQFKDALCIVLNNFQFIIRYEERE